MCLVISFRWIDGSAILCAGLTSYKGLKETEARPGEFITIIGAAGGLGHLGPSNDNEYHRYTSYDTVLHVHH